MKLTESTKWSWVWGALDAKLKAELLAGKHTEYHGLQQLWRDERRVGKCNAPGPRERGQRAEDE
jgi:hypothetical protein